MAHYGMPRRTSGRSYFAAESWWLFDPPEDPWARVQRMRAEGDSLIKGGQYREVELVLSYHYRAKASGRSQRSKYGQALHHQVEVIDGA